MYSEYIHTLNAIVQVFFFQLKKELSTKYMFST